MFLQDRTIICEYRPITVLPQPLEFNSTNRIRKGNYAKTQTCDDHIAFAARFEEWLCHECSSSRVTDNQHHAQQFTTTATGSRPKLYWFRRRRTSLAGE